jgi:1-acyl-sn-glycerol-3-phosphate acyltransferase
MFDQPLAIVCIVLAVILPLGWLVYQKRKTEFTWAQFALWVFAKGMTRYLWRTTYVNPLPEETRSGAIVVCNHRSGVDPFFLQVLCKRPMRWMVAKEYVEHRFFGWFLRTCGAIPVSRGGIDTAATKNAIRFAQEGGLVGMFPEGRLNMTETLLLPIRPGAVLVALRARRPLMPCYIEGSPTRGTPWSSFFMRAKVRVSFGELIDVSEYADVEQKDELVREIMTRVVHEIAKLAGQEDFEPQFAGRRWKPSDETVRSDAAAMRQRDRHSRGAPRDEECPKER